MKVEIILFHKSFNKAFKKLDKKIQREFKLRRDMMLVNASHPILNTHPLHGEWRGRWSINVTGNIRAVFKMERNIAIFIGIGTHSELYE